MVEKHFNISIVPVRSRGGSLVHYKSSSICLSSTSPASYTFKLSMSESIPLILYRLTLRFAVPHLLILSPYTTAQYQSVWTIILEIYALKFTLSHKIKSLYQITRV
jgi:hypothetical protein